MLIEKILENYRAAPVTIVTRTDPAMRKGRKKDGIYPNPFIDANGNSTIAKISKRNGFVGASYENCVNNQRDREDLETTFKAQELWNGKGRHLNKFVVEHTETGERYITFKPPVKDNAPQTLETHYVHKNGLPMTEDELMVMKEWLENKAPPTNQGVEKPVFWQTIKLANILEIKVEGQTYSLTE